MRNILICTYNLRWVFALRGLAVLIAMSTLAAQAVPIEDCNSNGSDDAAELLVGSTAHYEVSVVTYDFEDISSTGTAVVLDDDEVSDATSLGFTFEFFTQQHTRVRTISNGQLTFLDENEPGCCNGDPIPSAASPNALIAGWWDDLDPSAGGTIHYATGTAPDRFIVQFTNVPHFGGDNLVTMQFKLIADNNAIEIHYLAAPSDGDNHSVGIENHDGTEGVEYFRGATALTTPLAVRFAPGSADCNANGKLDDCDIAAGTSADCNGNVIPDDCEADCNLNGIPDACDVAAGSGADCDQSGVPDECKADCDSDGTPDVCEPTSGPAGDCNLNGVPDACDINGGTSSDCNDNGVPDSCDIGLCLESCGAANQGFETGDFTFWTTQDLPNPFIELQVAGAGVAGPGTDFFVSDPVGAYACLHPFDGNGPGTIRIAQDITLPPSATTLSFDYRAAWDLTTVSTIAATLDRTFVVKIERPSDDVVLDDQLVLTAAANTKNNDTGNLTQDINVSAYSGTTVRLAFEWYVPEKLTGPGFFQLDNIRCNGTGGGCVSDDDNANGVPDECDPPSGGGGSTTPPDADDDGVEDDDDLCPDTPAGADVDTSGCAESQIDDDGDGVTRDVDLCPGTPANAAIDENGCADSQIDDDGDGVTRDRDLCPGTPANAAVDANGCADAQADGDGDGVTRDRDLCPGTPANATIDANGCAASQLDDDNDGVNNDIDVCPETPAGEDADAVGCSASQRDVVIEDRDEDGTPDDVDLCPDEPGPESTKGCPEGVPGDGGEPGQDLPDSDGDGVPDNVDACPDQFGTEEDEGCPSDDTGNASGECGQVGCGALGMGTLWFTFASLAGMKLRRRALYRKR